MSERGKAHRPGCCVDKAYGSPRGCTPDTCMVLPDGHTCADCQVFGYCEALFGCRPDNTTCDWFPRRLRLRKKPGSES